MEDLKDSPDPRPGAPDPFSRREWIRLSGVMIFICLVYLATLSDKRCYRIGDGQMMYDEAVSMHQFGELGISQIQDSEPYSAARAEYYSRYGLGMSAAEQLPLLFVNFVERYWGEGKSNVLVPLMNVLITVLSSWFVALCARELGAGFAASSLAAIGFALCTPAWVYVSYDFSEPLQALGIIVALWSLLAGTRRHPFSPKYLSLAGIALGFAVLTKTLLVILVPGFSIYLWMRTRGRVLNEMRGLIGYVVFLAISALAVGSTNYIRFGGVFNSGYDISPSSYDPGFVTPLWSGLYGQLMSPSKGLIVYAPLTMLVPWAILKMYRSRWMEVALLALVVVPYEILNAKWWGWEGGASWGPRLILPIVPILVVIAAFLVDLSRLARWLFYGLMTAGFLVNLLGVMLNFLVWLNVIGLNQIRIPLQVQGRPPREYIEKDGYKWFRPSVAANYLPALSAIKGHAWLLSARYFEIPFSLRFLDEGGEQEPPLLSYPPIKIDFSQAHDAYLRSQLHSAHLWLWDIFSHAPREEIYTYPSYGVSMEHQGDRAVRKHDLARAIFCYRSASELMPNYVSPVLKLARLEWEGASPQEAVQVIEHYLDQKLNDQDQERAARLQLGEYYEALHNYAKAISQYQIYLSLNPSLSNRRAVEEHLEELSHSIP